VSEPNGTQVAALQRPTNSDKEAWKAYWKAQGQSWRTEPEIDAERQIYLTKRRAIVPNIENGVYPFKDIKLSRADVEWLLVTHENGRGPVDWSDVCQRERKGLDLRGANVGMTDLQELPLACLQCSAKWNVLSEMNQLQQNEALTILKGVNFRRTHLEGAILARVHLEQVNMSGAFLENAYLVRTHLEDATLWGAHIQGTNLTGTYLEGALLGNIVLSNEDRIGPIVVDTQWGSTNLAIVNWSQVKMLGDEHRIPKKQLAQSVGSTNLLTGYEKAVRAYRQLATALQNQGVNEDAARFAYRAQRLQRVVLRYQKKFGQYLFSLILDLLAGYGYRPGRSVVWYLVMIFGFALTYANFGHLPFFPDSLVFSLTSFHGRGFFPGLGSETSLHNPLVVLAAIEAVVGLFIEISFIATFTQRFFGK